LAPSVLPLVELAQDISKWRRYIELPIVTESEKKLLLAAVEFIYRGTKSMNEEKPTFQERLDYMRSRLPPIFTGSG